MNVGHGDSIVLEYHGDNSLISYAVIDSNCKFDSSPPALELLQSLGAEELSFVAITHPHADHYMGMRKILEYFSKRIDTLYTFPIRREREDIKKAIAIYKSFAINTDSVTSQKKLLEWAYFDSLEEAQNFLDKKIEYQHFHLYNKHNKQNEQNYGTKIHEYEYHGRDRRKE